MKRHFVLALAAIFSMVMAQSAKADLTLTAGDATFVFDSDAGGAGVLQRTGFNDTLENFTVVLRSNFEGNTQVFTLGSNLTVFSESNVGGSTGGVVNFNDLTIIGQDATPGGNNLETGLLFTLSESPLGEPILDVDFTYEGSNFISTTGGATLDLDFFFIFDFEGTAPGTEFAKVVPGGQFAGHTQIGDANSDDRLAADGTVTVDTAANLNAIINANNDFDGTISGGSSDLAAGLQFSFSTNVAGLGNTNFGQFTESLQVASVPEPNSAFGFGFILTFVLGLLGFDARRRQFARR